MGSVGCCTQIIINALAAVLSVTPYPNLREGEMVTLTCDVPGEDKQDLYYSWYKNNVWIKEGTARNLVFNAVAIGDAGYYSCKAQNDKGSEMSQAVGLSVFCEFSKAQKCVSSARIVITPSSEVHEGQEAHLSCAVSTSSSTPSNYTWYKDGRPLSEAHGNSLEFLQVARSDAGSYYCRVENERSSKSSTSATLSVLCK
uniref:Ig-like domain-containing protein n=1 Tax=Salvator merianae TaxID=96440 RepID=A0A8D0DRH6_SALMN